MKKELKVIVSAGLAALVVGVLIAFPPRTLACAGNNLTSENGDVTNCEDAPSDVTTIEKTETSEPDDEYYYGTADKLDSEVEVDHSLFLAGSDVTSKDDVNGIGFLAGNIVNAAGAYDYGFFAGNSVSISGAVENDLFVAGNVIEIKDDASIGRDVYAAGNMITISSNLSGKVSVAGNRLVLESVTIDGNLDVAAEEIVIKGKSSISGTFSYNEDAVIAGLEDLSFGSKETYANSSTGVSFLTELFNKLISTLGVLILAFVLIAVFKKTVPKLLKNFEAKDVFKDVLVGLGVLVLVPFASIFIIISIVGLPLGFVALLLWLIFCFLATPTSGLILGDVLAKKLFNKEKMNPFLKATLGIVLIELVSLVPYLGGLVSLASILFGTGFLLLSLKSKK